MDEAQENKVSGSGEVWNTTEFVHKFMSIWSRMTHEDERRLTDDLEQMKEQEMGLFAPWKCNDTSDDNKKQINDVRRQTEDSNRDTDKLNKNEESNFNQVMDKKVSEGVSERKIVEVVALENKILNTDDNDDSIVGVENGRETDQLNENKGNQVTENKVSKDSMKGNNEVTDGIGVNTGENNGDKMTKNNEETINEVSVSHTNELTINSGKIVENGVFKDDTVKINSGDEVLVEVELNNGVVESVDELENCLLYTSRCV